MWEWLWNEQWTEDGKRLKSMREEDLMYLNRQTEL